VTKVCNLQCQKEKEKHFSDFLRTISAICSETCHKQNGYCRTPGTCRCKVGWMGDDCSVVSVLLFSLSLTVIRDDESAHFPPVFRPNNNSAINIQAARMAIVSDHG
jgi:hypothetical protein